MGQASAPRAPMQGVPVFTLYGEAAPPPDAGFMHVELIESRSRLYDWEISRHVHRGLFQALFVFSGGVEARIDERQARLDGPAVLTVPPNFVHDFRFTEGTYGVVLTVAEAMLFEGRNAAEGVPLRELFAEPKLLQLTPEHPDAGRLEALLRQVLAEFVWPRAGHDAMMRWLVLAVLLTVARGHADAARPGEPAHPEADLFARFRLLIEAHYAEHWPMRRYADALSTTLGRLDRLCRRIAGRSAFDIVQERLMLEARRRLVFIAAPIASLAYELGFQDPAYFCRFFKKHAGLSPSAYRLAAQHGTARD